MNNLTKYLLAASAIVALLHFLFFSPQNTTAPEKRQHRIVFQLTTPDTAAYRALTRQLNNVLAHWPGAQLEVVAHNKGIGMLLKDKTNVQPEITALKNKGIQFIACENTLKQQNLEKSQIVAEAGFVPVGIAAIVERQEDGWSYIKAGF
ncbi:MAG: DsrE family protein [Saprospiraceae bacterium]|nr:DsrE family protein [Saprospiraceae bacterium]